MPNVPVSDLQEIGTAAAKIKYIASAHVLTALKTLSRHPDSEALDNVRLALGDHYNPHKTVPQMVSDVCSRLDQTVRELAGAREDRAAVASVRDSWRKAAEDRAVIIETLNNKLHDAEHLDAHDVQARLEEGEGCRRSLCEIRNALGTDSRIGEGTADAVFRIRGERDHANKGCNAAADARDQAYNRVDDLARDVAALTAQRDTAYSTRDAASRDISWWMKAKANTQRLYDDAVLELHKLQKAYNEARAELEKQRTCPVPGTIVELAKLYQKLDVAHKAHQEAVARIDSLNSSLSSVREEYKRDREWLDGVRLALNQYYDHNLTVPQMVSNVCTRLDRVLAQFKDSEKSLSDMREALGDDYPHCGEKFTDAIRRLRRDCDSWKQGYERLNSDFSTTIFRTNQLSAKLDKINDVLTGKESK